MADFGNLAILDANIGTVTRQSCPIDNHAAFNDCIELCHKVPPF
jgi:hypothetical protein